MLVVCVSSCAWSLSNVAACLSSKEAGKNGWASADVFFTIRDGSTVGFGLPLTPHRIIPRTHVWRLYAIGSTLLEGGYFYVILTIEDSLFTACIQAYRHNSVPDRLATAAALLLHKLFYHYTCSPERASLTVLDTTPLTRQNVAVLGALPHFFPKFTWSIITQPTLQFDRENSDSLTSSADMTTRSMIDSTVEKCHQCFR